MDINRKHDKPPSKPIKFDASLAKRTAYHEAGHATAIYFYNKQHKLPAVFFQISTGQFCGNKIDHKQTSSANNTSVEGGLLFQNLPVSAIAAKNQSSTTVQQKLQIAYEADIVNLLAGPIAEAKYIALRDDEVFNPLLITVESLKFYGGKADLEQVNAYLDSFRDNSHQRKQKLAELFTKTFHFVDDRRSWKAIASLATYILNSKNQVISCEQAFSILDECYVLLSKVIEKT